MRPPRTTRHGLSVCGLTSPLPAGQVELPRDLWVRVLQSSPLLGVATSATASFSLCVLVCI